MSVERHSQAMRQDSAIAPYPIETNRSVYCASGTGSEGGKRRWRAVPLVGEEGKLLVGGVTALRRLLAHMAGAGCESIYPHNIFQGGSSLSGCGCHTACLRASSIVLLFAGCLESLRSNKFGLLSSSCRRKLLTADSLSSRSSAGPRRTAGRVTRFGLQKGSRSGARAQSTQ